MAVNLFGLTSVVVTPDSKLIQDAAGAYQFTERRVGKTAAVVTLFNSLVRQVTAHPTYIFLGLESKVVTFEDGGQATIDLVWVGASTETSGTEPTELPPPVWDLKRSPSQEPIDTHPDFENFAGNAGLPINGAVFDEDGIFKAFKPDDPNVWGGVSKYLENAAVLTKASVVLTEPNTSEIVPRIEAPPSPGITLPVITGRNWLKTDFTVRRVGSVYEVFEEWTMSGQQGWNADIYP